MSLAERIIEVNQKNNELNSKLELELQKLTNLIKTKINSSNDLETQMESQTDSQTKSQTESQTKSQTKSHTEKELFYESQNETIISMFNIKTNQDFTYPLRVNNQNVNLIINVFQLTKLKYTNNSVKAQLNDITFTFDPKTVIPNATIEIENDTTVIVYDYEYEEKYRNCTASLVSLGFDYEIKLTDYYYTNLYNFENEYGKFRVDLRITLV